MADIIKQKMINAYNLLLKNDAHLFDVNVNERSLTHKLAEYLQFEFPVGETFKQFNKDDLDKLIMEK